MSSRASVANPSVHGEYVASDHAGLFGRKEHRRVGDVYWLYPWAKAWAVAPSQIHNGRLRQGVQRRSKKASDSFMRPSHSTESQRPAMSGLPTGLCRVLATARPRRPSGAALMASRG